MKNNLKVGVTGGICSGKSQIMAYLKQKGYPVFSCDEINATLLEDAEYIKKVQAICPDCVVNDKIDKKALASIIFSSEEKRKLIEGIAHPLILERLFLTMSSQAKVSFAEVPLLFEGNLVQKFDKILVVMRKRDTRLQAAILRDGSSEVEARLKMKSQFPYEKAFEEGFFEDSKYVLIFNDGPIENAFAQVDDFLSNL